MFKRVFHLSVIAICGLAFSLCANAQACGYPTFTTYLQDTNGKAIKNAAIRLYEPELGIEQSEYFREATRTEWIEELQAYSTRHGMCGGHEGVGLMVSADGYESMRQVIDLPLGKQIYLIQLQPKGSRDKAKFATLSELAGVVLDPRGAVIVKAKITAKSVTGQEYKTATNEYGNYSLLLPVTNYGLGVLSSEDFEKQPLAKFELIVEANGFKKTVIKEFTHLTQSCDFCLSPTATNNIA
jgi:hypothetical protein